MRNGSELFGRQAASVEDIGKAGQEARAMVDGIIEVSQVRERESVESSHFVRRPPAHNIVQCPSLGASPNRREEQTAARHGGQR